MDRALCPIIEYGMLPSLGHFASPVSSTFDLGDPIPSEIIQPPIAYPNQFKVSKQTVTWQ